MFADTDLLSSCQSLPKSDSYNLNKPVFDIQERTKDSYICTVTLPPSSRVRTLTSSEFYSDIISNDRLENAHEIYPRSLHLSKNR